ncbi:anterior gradient protein 2 homolog [Salarias fasciatus]|uniref:anterior gradient protein 2 homolog n=1 Tax=Salarias fasciatus TaxID=181472 RepID=UPI001176907A|nr:anterior gradient protein 2 homolog [Salarias fasciatus]
MTRAAASLVLVLVALSSTFTKYVPKSGQRIPQSLSRGWGDQLNWAQTYEEALSLSRSTNKPLMVLFHLEDCSQCDALKRALAHDDEIQRILDEDFVVLNVIQETVDQNMSPDGKYVPRIVFVDPSMTVRDDIIGRYSNRLYGYEAADMNVLLDNMKKAKKVLKFSPLNFEKLLKE